MKVTRKTSLKEILSLPGAEKVLEKHKVPCLTCPFASMEMETLKIEEIAQTYGLKLEKILKELNNLKVKDKKDN